VAASYGILIMMACHRLEPAAWPGKGLWYDEKVTEQMVLDSWSKLAASLCGRWNVFAVDLQNEPHAASWGKHMGDHSDWGHAAERIGNHVLSECPRWLCMVEGVGYDPGALGMDSPTEGIWWGENLAGASPQPVVLKDMTKLVYSPHTYGPSVYMQSYFSAPGFPSNLAALWESRFAYLPRQSGQPVVIGEMGGFYTGKDKEWQDWAISFMKRKGIGLFYFALQPTSDDTGGLLLSDWTSPHSQKLQMLSQLPSTDVAALQGIRPPAASK